MRHVVVFGGLDGGTVVGLLGRCRQLSAAGSGGMVLNLTRMRCCDRDALTGLLALQDGAGGLPVAIHGAHPAQFLELLAATPLQELLAVHADVTRLTRPADTIDRDRDHIPGAHPAAEAHHRFEWVMSVRIGAFAF